MDVEVRHFLAAVRAGIGEQAIAGRDQPRLARDLADGADEAGDLRVRGLAPRNRPRRRRRPLGITRMWVGACGLMSWKASACSSS